MNRCVSTGIMFVAKAVIISRRLQDAIFNDANDVCAIGGVSIGNRKVGQQQDSTNQSWTLDQLIDHSQDNPNDSFAKYAALRLAEKKSVAERNRLLRSLGKRNRLDFELHHLTNQIG